MTDVKTYDFHNSERGEVKAGTPVHEMWVRITVDDDLLIHDAEASTEYAPYSICPQAAPAMDRIKGIRIGAGWRREVNKRIGGTLGCTHLRELLGPMATTAYQTIIPIKAAHRGSSTAKRPAIIGTCHAYAPDSPVVKRLWPAHYRASGDPEQ